MALFATAGMRLESGLVWLEDDAGRPIVGVGSLKFNGQGNARTVLSAADTNGAHAISLSLGVERNPDARVEATVREFGDRYELDFALTAPTNFSIWGVQGTLKRANGIAKPEFPEKHGIWNRCAANPRDGEPFETPNAKLKRFGDAKGALWYVLEGDENWSPNSSEHFPFSLATNGTCRCHATLYKARPDEEGFEVAARHAGRPFAVALTTPRRNNIFDSGTPEVTLRVSNTGATNAVAKVRFFARDWDGGTPFDRTGEMALKPGERGELTAQLPAERGIWFVEGGVVVAAATAGGLPEVRKEGAIPGGPGAVPAERAEVADIFTRTTIVFLPPYEFRHRDTSIFGIINRTDRCFRREKAEEMALVARMGAHWLRSGHDWELMERHGIEPIGLVDFTLGRAYDSSNPKDVSMISNRVASLILHGVRYAEMGNELGYDGDTEARRRLFTNYVTWLDAYRAERERQGGSFKIIYGTSSCRPGLMRTMEECGTWRKLDEYVIHPARGYWTADMDSRGWRFLGLVRGTRRIMREEFGIDNPRFHLTEVYAKTMPNSSWADSYRQSAESMVLTAALSLSEPGVVSFCVHKLHEGVGFNDNGVNHKNMEYHYGLLHRDNAPKPSFMGYVTAAEELDGATFNRWIFRDEKADKLRGLVYDTPRGPLALLWDRTEGFLLTDHAPVKRVKGAPFFHWEPWFDHWRVKKPHTFKAAGGEVTTIDCIGRRKTMPVKDGHVTLFLDGGPRFVYGLDLSEFTDTSRHEREHNDSDIEEIDRQNRE